MCPERDALGIEFIGTGLLRRLVKYRLLPGDFEVCESQTGKQLFQLCFQQSTGYSPGPEIDIGLG